MIREDGVLSPFDGETHDPRDDPLHLERLQYFTALRMLRIEVLTPISIGIRPLRTLSELPLYVLEISAFNEDLKFLA